MAISLDLIVHPQVPVVALGQLKAKVITATFDSDYDAGGASLTPALVGLSEILMVVASIDAGDNGAVVGGGFVPQYNYATQKLQMFQQTDPADAGGANVPLTEVTADSGEVEDVVVRLLVIGF